MIDLKKYIYESLLDNEEDLIDKSDKTLLHPFRWFYEESTKCKDFNQLYKLILEFHNIIKLKHYSSEIHPRMPRPKTGIYSNYWDLKSLRYSKNDLICRFNFDINDPGISTHKNDLLYIGFCKSEGLALNIDRQKITWRIIGSDKIRDVLVKNNDKVYYINPSSSIKTEYSEIFEQIKK